MPKLCCNLNSSVGFLTTSTVSSLDPALVQSLIQSWSSSLMRPFPPSSEACADEPHFRRTFSIGRYTFDNTTHAHAWKTNQHGLHHINHRILAHPTRRTAPRIPTPMPRTLRISMPIPSAILRLHKSQTPSISQPLPYPSYAPRLSPCRQLGDDLGESRLRGPGGTHGRCCAECDRLVRARRGASI